jgi:hypothetical protein
MGTETEGTKPGTEEPKNDAPEAAKKDDDTVSIRKGELAGYKTQLREMKKALEEFTNMRSAEEAAKLKAAADWEALEKKTKAELETVKADLEKSRRSVLIESARSALLGAGIPAGLIVEGALSHLPLEIEADAIPGWVDDLRTKHPNEFKTPLNPIGAPSAGAAARPTGDEASALKAKAAATKGKGPAAMEAVMREVAAYTAAHGGKNPLV